MSKILSSRRCVWSKFAYKQEKLVYNLHKIANKYKKVENNL